MGDWLEPGTHVTSVGGRPDGRTYDRVDVSLRLGSAPGPVGLPAWKVDDESVTYAARGAQSGQDVRATARAERGHGRQFEDKSIFLEDLLAGRAQGRTDPNQITYSERGNIQGAQFFAVAGAVYEAAKGAGVGRVLPTEWFLQDIRD
jgi:ornithine cyclodeaminase/alanine dehydrogenase-like protein (mu-crystallin family)